MSGEATNGGLSAEDLTTLLDVTRDLAAPFDLMSMLAAVTAAARQVLRAERCSVWLHDRANDELVLEVATDIRHVRIRVGTGLVGACARDRKILNVPDCYADPRFDQETDRRSGYRSRCSLTLPLIDHEGGLVGVMQVLNRLGGVFGGGDEALASALAAQCGVALQRVRMIDTLLASEKMRQELETARVVQMSTLPSAMPVVAGYDAHGTFIPAELTGGDTFDLALLDGRLLLVLGDATGHGIAPALSVTQMHAMLRMAFRVGAELERAFLEVNNQLAETLADDRFVTAFIGLLDPATHTLRYISAGQGPILHFHAGSGICSRHRPTCFPLGAMALAAPRPAAQLSMEPGDVLLLLSDGIYEFHDDAGAQFGEARVEAAMAAGRDVDMATLATRLLDAVRGFAGRAVQQDDISMVLLKRNAASP